ncbi:uncharacterized protein BP01DRAFT_359434 [Aspergillus saccharolyticus JOP 1030-1]|uniref:Uncharacterized protein n=1 Tax=Aspergillus saccharolyticus JOP 1030-1 TaxID=1450539 RepID=A0A318Z629_9EURO|nr:hypothetical protein BP01DRAFT_359434 [Aspergillus saccharolyticus JOP 1030-1]PYH42566.1 hypothetical protein BP01DRAFT_359434 [Aspergillus saccharolyticus JOP 1030-1]
MPSQVLGYPTGFSTEVTAGPSIAGTADEYELRFARRALERIKSHLGLEATEKLVQPDIDESNRFWQRVLAENTTGEFKPARIELSVKGITMEEFLPWFRNRCQRNVSNMLAGQPEHWVVSADEQGNEKVIENLGPWVSRFFIKFEAPSQPFQLNDIREDFPLRMTGYGHTDDGSINGYVLHQFRPHTDGSGFDVNLCIYFPASAPEVLFEQHRQHLVVEFTNWTRHCYRELKVEGIQM